MLRLAAARPCTAVPAPGYRGFLLPGDCRQLRVSVTLLRADARPVLRVNRPQPLLLRVPVPPGRGVPLPQTSWRCQQRAVTLSGPAGARPPCVAPHPAPAAADNAGLRPPISDTPEPPAPSGRNAPP